MDRPEILRLPNGGGSFYYGLQSDRDAALTIRLDGSHVAGLMPVGVKTEGMLGAIGTKKASVDYYELLTEGGRELTAAAWQDIIKDVMPRTNAPWHLQIAEDTIADLLFDLSGEWVDKRRRITSKAFERSENPLRRSDYCLSAIKEAIAQAIRESEDEASPELAQVRRQVADHLRKLRAQKLLFSFKIKSRQGRDLCVMWALLKWEPGAQTRTPTRDLDSVKELLPAIRAAGSGLGVFDYGHVLPGYLPTILELYEAALSTAQMTFTVVAKISPPLASFCGVEDHESMQQWKSLSNAHDLMEGRQMWESFMQGLDARERLVLEHKNRETPIEEIAKAVGCTPRTVNNLWSGILAKAADCLKNLGTLN